jgi:hypothetical protein
MIRRRRRRRLGSLFLVVVVVGGGGGGGFLHGDFGDERYDELYDSLFHSLVPTRGMNSLSVQHGRMCCESRPMTKAIGRSSPDCTLYGREVCT